MVHHPCLVPSTSYYELFINQFISDKLSSLKSAYHILQVFRIILYVKIPFYILFLLCYCYYLPKTLLEAACAQMNTEDEDSCEG